MVTHQEREKELVEFWKKNKVFEKSVNQRSKDKEYLFYDGPPFATGTPHHGHILGLTIKDVYPRFWTMKGYRVERRWGWDCHGLPIEHIAEKELGIKEKKGIEEYGVDKFNEFCRSKVFQFADEWKKIVDRIGKWIEFDNSYKTMDNSYMESVWNIFKNLYDKGYVYEGKKILMYCSRCETPLSNNEIAMDNSYKDVTEKTAYVKFKVKNNDNTYLLAWTTTPWTLIGNVALAVNSKLDYVKVKVKVKGEYYILAKERLEILDNNYEIIENFKGKKLLNTEYGQLYDINTDKKAFYVIDGGKEVSSEDGSGIVHMAVYGEFDYEMIKKYDLPIIQHLNNSGKLILGPKDWHGFYFKKVNKYVLEDLENKNQLLRIKEHNHSCPFCYRCDSPLFYNAVGSWFVDIQKIKSKLIERKKNIAWYPKNIETRFNYNLNNAPDWSISRNRFWATAMPIWKCDDKKCNNLEVIGSVEELQKLATKKIPRDLDLHKHVIDKIQLKCSKCNNNMTRIPEVLDCWFESGSMPYAANHYPFENKKEFEKKFPADFVSEYVAQVRTWYYYMHVIGVLLFDRAPFKNVVVSGNILASDGSKMSKSKKNFTPPEEILDKFGADALRFYLMSTPLTKAEDSNFYDNGVSDSYRSIINLLTNVKKFYQLYEEENILDKKNNSKNILDLWILSRLNELNKEVTKELDSYNTIKTCAEIARFINDLSTWYLRRSRDRLKSNNLKVKEEALHTISICLLTLSKLIAPITPFISEDIYQMFRKSNKNLLESVHLEDWPKLNLKKVSEEINSNMSLTRELVGKILDEREKVKIPIRQVLSKVTLFGINLPNEYHELIKDEVNVKNVELKDAKKVSVKLDTKLTDELLEEGVYRELVRKFNNERKKLGLTIQDTINIQINTKDELIKNSIERFKTEMMDNLQAKKIDILSEKLENKVIIKEKEISYKLLI